MKRRPPHRRTLPDLAREEAGEVLILQAVTLAFLLGICGLVLDIGTWYTAQRQAQAVADASALAGAQALPGDTADAAALAVDYASRNGGVLASGDITFATDHAP